MYHIIIIIIIIVVVVVAYEIIIDGYSSGYRSYIQCPSSGESLLRSTLRLYALFDLIIMTPIRTYSQLSIIINLIIYFCNLFELYNIYIHLRLWGDLIMVAHATNQPSRTEGGVYTLQSANGQEMWDDIRQ